MNHRIGPTFRFCQSRFKGALVAAAFLAAMFWALAGQAQPLVGGLLGSHGSHQKDKDKPPGVQKGNRFLFIIDTSSSMRADALYVRDTVTDLLKSAMQGEMRDGDTLGLWNYDDQLHTEFPMQIWSTEHSPMICERVAAYLTDREYHKRAHLDKVLPYVTRLIESSRLITIIFVYDGSQPMQGTRFDQDINDLQKQFLKEVRAADLPFVTILAARDGKAFEYTVNVPNAIVVPHTAEPLTNAPPATNAAPPVAVQTNDLVPAEPAPPQHFEIVMAGPHAHRTSAAPPDGSAVASAGAAVPASAPGIATPTAQSTVQSPTAATVPAPTVAQTIPTPTPIPPASPLPSPSPGTATNPVALTFVPVAAPPGASQVVTTTDGWNVVVRNAGTPTASVVQTASASAAGAPASPNVPAAAPSTVSPSPPPQSAPAPATVSAPPIPAPQVAQAVAPQSASVAPSEPAGTSRPDPPANESSRTKAEPLLEPVAVSAVTVPSTGDHIALLVIALSLLTIAVVLVVFLMRRSRGGSHPSFISQSIDRSP